MKPLKTPHTDRQCELFCSELIQIINLKHALVELSKAVSWKRLEEIFGETYCDDNGRAAVEPGIGHLKREYMMDRNRLKGKEGDMLNAILSAAGMNFHKLLKHAAAFWRPVRTGRPKSCYHLFFVLSGT